jgi:hypothetical protein
MITTFCSGYCNLTDTVVPHLLLISTLLFVSMITKNVSILMLTVAVLGATALILNPGRIVYAQGNATSTINVDIWVEALKAKHPTLATIADIADIADIAEDKDVIGKLKDLDAKEAIKTLIALNIVRDLMQYKQAQEVQ